MEISAHFFYNYKTVGDVLMALIDNEKIPTHYEKINNVVFIYHNEELIGINFFNISEIIKIKSIGKIILPPKALTDVINTILLAISPYQFTYTEESGFVIGKIIDKKVHTGSDKLYLLKVDIGDEILNIVSGAENIEINKCCVVAKVGSMGINGQIIKEENFLGAVSKGMACSKRELGIHSEEKHRLLILEEDNLKLGSDFFLTKGV